MKATERLWLTADKKRLVGEGHPQAATLYAAEGDEIPDAAGERFGLKDGALPGARKEKEPADNKDAGPAENKRGGRASDGGGLKVNKTRKKG